MKFFKRVLAGLLGLTVIYLVLPLRVLAVEDAPDINVDKLKIVRDLPIQRKPLRTLSQKGAKFVENEVVVKFKRNKTPEALAKQTAERSQMAASARAFDNLKLKAKGEKPPEELLSKFEEKEKKLNITDRKSLDGGFVLTKSKNKTAGELVKGFKELETVEFAEPNFIYKALRVPNDLLYAGYQWNLKHINSEKAWETATGSNNIMVAVVDTGVGTGNHPVLPEDTYQHPELKGKLVAGYDFIRNSPYPFDEDGHGTHVASNIAAVTNNNEGIAGISWGAKIMPVKVLDTNGDGTSDDLAAGIRWAADHGAKIINLSLGGKENSILVEEAVDYAYGKGILLVAAAGNDFKEGNPTTYPAAYGNVLAVAATNDLDGHASYSNSGSYVDIAAPGGDAENDQDPVITHWITGAYWAYEDPYIYTDYYFLLVGTSQAAPHVSGLAALLLSVNPNFTNSQLESLIKESAVDIGAPGRDDFFGYGRIDLAAAISRALSPTPSPSPTPTIANCGADINCNGRVDYSDLNSWRGLFNQKSVKADLNQDNVWNILDYLKIFRSWFQQ